MKILLSLLLPFALFIFGANSELYLFIGETGAGKSSSMNWLAQREIAAEGHGFSSETSDAITYAIERNGLKHFIDVPGILDTSGLTENEIAQLIKTEIFKQRENHGFDKISGIIIVLDASLTRIRVRDSIVAAIKMFGESCLGSIVIAINKVEKVPLEQRQAVLNYVTSEANAVGIAANCVVPIDSKGNLGTYYPALEQKLRELPGYYLAGMNELDQRAEAYFQEELNKGENYVDYVENVPRIIERAVHEQIFIDEHYTERCDCRRVCSKRILGICVDRETVCGTCHRTRQVPRMITRIIQETVYDQVHHRNLKNGHEHYRRVARDRVVEEIRNFVFQQRNQRNNHRDL